MKPKRKVDKPFSSMQPAAFCLKNFSTVHDIPLTSLANVLPITFKYQISMKVMEKKGWQRDATRRDIKQSFLTRTEKKKTFFTPVKLNTNVSPSTREKSQWSSKQEFFILDNLFKFIKQNFNK